jgi:NADH-quinone oxidoreductase subunit N
MFEPINVTLESLNLNTLTPMLVATMGALLILVIDLIKKDLHKSLYVMLGMLILAIDLGTVIGQQVNARGFFDIMLVDGIAIIAQVIILLGSLIFLPLALGKSKFHEYRYPEYFAMFLFMVAGLQFMVASDNLIMIFVGLETSSLALYTLIALHNRERSFEAAIKYFTMGALAASLFAFGAAILYGLTGSLEIHQIAESLAQRNYEPITLVLGAAVLLIGALGFKLSIVPFHTWTPDVYEGSSAPLAGYMSVMPKVAGFVVAIRLFEFMIQSGIWWVHDMLMILGVLTMIIANITALVQNDVKRMLAFSSISHAGFLMLAIVIGTTKANSALFLYFALFLFANMGAFTMLWISRHKSNIFHDRYDHPFEKFAGMIKIQPVGAVLMALFMLSLAGVPPFSLFWGKMYVISAAVDSQYIVLALIMALNSAIAAYYYLKLIVYMFLKDPAQNDGTVYVKNASKSLQTVIGISAFVTVAAILFVGPVLDIITQLIAVSGY